MPGFFKGQLDYVYFCYGLAFLVLAAICFTLQREREHRLAWFWLGLFAVTFGASEWLELFTVNIGESGLFSAVRLGGRILAYVFLFEFARIDIFRLRPKLAKAWIYLPFLLLSVSGAFFGGKGLNFSSYYFLGLPAGLFSAWVLVRASKFETNRRHWLIISALALFIYAIFNAVFVPKISLLAEGGIFPVQIIRVALALFLVISLWFYSQVPRFPGHRLLSHPIYLQLSTWVALTLIAIITSGWFFTNYLGDFARAKLIKDSKNSANDLTHHLMDELTKSEQAVMTLSGSPWILPALITGKKEDLDNARSALDRYNRSLRMSGCFLLDSRGSVIVTSSRIKPEGLAGKSLEDMPYFKKSMVGWPAYYFAVESPSEERCYYASFPVRSEAGDITGAVVIKKNIDNIEGGFVQYPYSFLVDPSGVIFLSANRSFLFSCLWPVNDSVRRNLLSTGQYGKNRQFNSLLTKEVFDGQQIVFNNEGLYVVRQLIGREGWSIVLLSSEKPIFQYRLFGIMIILFLCILVLVFLMAVRQREKMLAIVATVNTQLKTVLDAATQVSIIATEMQGLVTVFNTGAEKMLGYSAEDMVEMHTPEIIHLEEEIEARSRELSEEFSRPVKGFDVLVEYARLGLYEQREWTYVCKDGKYITVSLSVTAQRDTHGMITGFLFVATDITARKRAEYELQEQKEFSENLVQNAAVAIFVIDANHNVIFWNKACEELTGFKARDMIGSPDHWRAFYKNKRPVMADIVVEGKSEKVLEFYGSEGKLALTPSGLRAEGWYPSLGGKDRYIIFEAAPIYNSKGKLVAAIETLNDITERKLAEEALARQTQELARSNTELERFAYIASHDLQEPLRMVSSYIQLLEKRYKGKLDSSADDFIGYIVEGVFWMQSLINALLTYSRVGTQAKEFEATNCNQVIARTLMNLQVAIEESGAVITCDNLPTIFADGSQLIQLFQNLIGNAIKFKGEESPRIHVSCERKGNEWVFSVKDNGIGIAPQYFTRIFEIFQRLHSRKEYPGTGIGLAVCKKIIERHGGRIWLESTPGSGSIFYFAIPIPEAE
ncbi:MAG: PAS domain S-box protein [Candidatus Omnitrophica bacterium]|nr:PAS domain S-box protein [Candidatus Omnitrophota bacterium]